MLPSFSIFCKKSDIDKESDINKDSDLKTLYICNNYKYPEEYIIYNYRAPGPTSSFCDEKCEINLCRKHSDDYVEAYPDHITIKDLHTLFPNCLIIHSSYPIDLSSLVIFHNLRGLCLRTNDQIDINGIEFLNLKHLTLSRNYTEMNPTRRDPSLLGNFSLLNFLRLKSLMIYLDTVTDLGYLNIETLETLQLGCKHLRTLKGMKLPNLKSIYIDVLQYGLLMTFDLPVGCEIHLADYFQVINYESRESTSTKIYEIMKGMFPDSNIEFYFD
jgi:hypothetical protein